MNVALCISSLGAGGAERVMSVMASHWAQQGHSITLITLAGDTRDAYPMHPAVTRVALDLLRPTRSLPHRAWMTLRRIRAIRRAVVAARAEVVISFMDRVNLLTLLATAGLRRPVIVSERVDPRMQQFGRGTDALRWWVYRTAAEVVVQTQAAARWIEQQRGIVAQVIPNPLAEASCTPIADRSPVCLAVGRLCEQKNHRLLLDAFTLAAAEFSQWQLHVAEDGPLRGELEAQAQALGMADRVRFLGHVANVHDLMRSVSVFALSSDYEGFPNALIEAMSAGVAVVATDCPSGPAEIIRDGHDGLLVPPRDVDALSEGLRELMAKPELRRRLGEAATEIRARLSSDRVMSMWDGLVLRERDA